MKYKMALALAIGEMKHTVKTLSFDAHLVDQYGSTDTFAVNAHKRRAKLREAIEVLVEEMEKIK